MKKTPILLVLVGALLAIPAASAHVTVNPRTLPANSFSSFAIRVPDEARGRGDDEGHRPAARETSAS